MTPDQELLKIGVIQFGHFETAPGHFQPAQVNLRLLASYPAILSALARELAALARVECERSGATHLLVMPSAVPLGVALSLETQLPLVYPAADRQTLEGAFDYNVPTLLITDVLTNGAAEHKLIAQARREGLDVVCALAVFDLGGAVLIGAKGTDHAIQPVAWRRGADLVAMSVSPFMQTAVQNWLAALRIS